MNVEEYWGKGWSLRPEHDKSTMECLGTITRSGMVSNLKGVVSRRTLLAQIPFVENVDEELAAVKEEAEEELKRQQEVFGLQDNTPPEQDLDDKEKVDE